MTRRDKKWVDETKYFAIITEQVIERPIQQKKPRRSSSLPNLAQRRKFNDEQIKYLKKLIILRDGSYKKWEDSQIEQILKDLNGLNENFVTDIS